MSGKDHTAFFKLGRQYGMVLLSEEPLLKGSGKCLERFVAGFVQHMNENKEPAKGKGLSKRALQNKSVEVLEELEPGKHSKPKKEPKKKPKKEPKAKRPMKDTDPRKRRGLVVKQTMKKHNLSFIEASKYVKENNIPY